MWDLSHPIILPRPLRLKTVKGLFKISKSYKYNILIFFTGSI